MKKLIVILALVAVVGTPAMAAVTVSCAQVAPGSKDCDVNYNLGVSDVNYVRAFALDITVSAGTITAVSCASTAYYIYPGSIQISGGTVTGYGDCVCVAGKGGALGGRGTSGVTVEMGSLYTGTGTVDHPKPATSGRLVRLTVSTLPATVTIASDTARGGAVVMERPEEVPAVTLSTCALADVITECFPSGYTSYNDWKSMGKPDCWCGTNTVGMIGTAQWKFQCYGDADNKTENFTGKYRVYNNDYWKLVSNWQKKITDPALDACADFDHKSENFTGKYRVYNNDYWRMVSNWQKKDSAFPGSGNCPTGI